MAFVRLIGLLVSLPFRIMLAAPLSVLLLALAALASYTITAGEFNNASDPFHDGQCLVRTFDDPKSANADIPEYHSRPDVMDEINAVRGRTARYFTPFVSMIANTYSSAGPDAGLQATLATFDFLPRYMSSRNGDVRFVDRIRRSDLLTDIYYGRAEDGVLDVYVAFEGTNWTELGDVRTNLAWFLAVLGPSDFDDARQVFVEAREAASTVARAENRKLRFLTLGHSLGGALAQHIAFGFPCVSAVVLDSSFVVNRHSFAEPNIAPHIVHLGDRGDVFTILREGQHSSMPYSWFVRLLGMPFEGFMPGGNTMFYTINATERSEDATLLEDVIAQHDVDEYVATMLDLDLRYRWNVPDFHDPSFRLRCLSRLGRPRCDHTAYCQKHDDFLRNAGERTFEDLCVMGFEPPQWR